jgi:WD40 repeat protein
MAVIEVAIGPSGVPGRFKVEVVDSPAGQLSAVAELDTESLAARHGLLQQEVLASGVRTRGVPETEQLLREAGQALFAGLLGADGMAGCYRASAALAAERGEQLRVALRIDDPALAGLPWEAMFDPELGAYVCRRDQMVRLVRVASVPMPLQVRPPLRILGVVSSPRNLPRLDADREKAHLARALAGPVSQGMAEVHWTPDATWAGLQDLLMDGEWHVLHYIGHGSFNPTRDEGLLALEREDGEAELVTARRLVDLLRQAHPMPRLAVLNSCTGAVTGSGDLFSGTAAALVRGGVSAVTAMQYEISDDAAIAFARGFYAAIARGRGVDDAVSSGRVAIIGTSDHTLEWVTPVLYLRGRQARLFPLPEPAGATRPSASSIVPSASPPALPSPSRLAYTLAGHTEGVHCVAFSPDGKLLATASLDGTSRVWDPATGHCLHTLRGHNLTVLRVAFSPDGKLLATASLDGTSRVWDPATGHCLRTLDGHTGLVPCAAFSPDGHLLATGGDDRTVRVWEPATGRSQHTLDGHSDTVTGVVFSPDGHLLATADDNRAVRVWDPATGRCLHSLHGQSSMHTLLQLHFIMMSGMEFSPDGHLLATVSDDRTVRVSDLATGRCQRTLTGHAIMISGIAFNPDGKLLATAGWDTTARVWDPATGRCLQTLTGHTSRVISVAFSPDGHLLATAGFDATARVWDPATGHCLQTLTGHTSRVISVAFSPDGKMLATASDDATTQLWR